MEKHALSAWERLEFVMQYTKIGSASAFARQLGLNRGENLYQIKKGSNGISLALARLIHSHYPELDVLWLMCGDGSPFAGLSRGCLTNSGEILKIPLCANFGRVASDEPPQADRYLYFSSDVCPGAQLATYCLDDALAPRLARGACLLLRECDDVLYGQIYLIRTASFSLLRVVRRAPDPEALLLATLQPDHYDELTVGRTDVRALYLVCAAITNLCM